MQEGSVDRRGIYNVEYFSGAQVSLYIGDIWIDEITSISYGYQQSRSPIFGYASTLYDDLSQGQVLIQGSFTINFKEAGYLWLVLKRYQELNRGKKNAFESSALATKETIENLVNQELSVFERNRKLQKIAGSQFAAANIDKVFDAKERSDIGHASQLTGFSDIQRSRGSIGNAEDQFEAFEDAVWGKKGTESFLVNRRVDSPEINPFDIYLAFGDFAGDGTVNHTIERIDTVTILGKSKQIVIDGMPIQEQYSFIGRDLV